MSNEAAASTTGVGQLQQQGRQSSEPGHNDDAGRSPSTLSAPVAGSSRATSSGKRASAACTRCRRYRQKCLMDNVEGKPVPPCQACLKLGRRAASQCAVVPRGQSAPDRNFRRRRKPSIEADDDIAVGRETRLADYSGNDATSDRGLSTWDSQAREHSPAAGRRLENEASSSTRSPSAMPQSQTLTTQSRPRGTKRPAPAVASRPVDRDRMLWPSFHSIDLLPDRAEVLDGVRGFLWDYMQLGFLPRALFLEQLEQDLSSAPVLLILSMLALNARFTPSLAARFGGHKQASAEMRRRALSLVADEMTRASVEGIQGLFLLSVSEFGEGNGSRSWLLTGIAIRMAATLGLHKEETYALAPDAGPEAAIRSESMRRSFWQVYCECSCHDQQIAGRSPSTTFHLSSIDVLLPSDEDSFIFGQVPTYRAALPGTRAAGPVPYAMTPSAIVGQQADPTRQPSLFATMIVGQWLWARTAERACRPLDLADIRPWDPSEDFARLDSELRTWEQSLAPRFVFSAFTLRAMRTQHLDLGFLSISLLLRLSHIVLRRAYLPWMTASYTEGFSDNSPPGYWRRMALEMVQNCVSLHELIETGLAVRPVKNGYPAVFIFGVYMCGDIACHLVRWPQLSPTHAPSAPAMLETAMHILEALEEPWPLATRWRTTLQQLVSSTPPRSTFDAALRSGVTPTEQTQVEDTSSVHIGTAQAQSPLSLFMGIASSTLSNTRAEPGEGLVTQPPAIDSAIAHAEPTTQNDQTPWPLSLTDYADFGADLKAFLRGEAFDWSVTPDASGQPSTANMATVDPTNSFFSGTGDGLDFSLSWDPAV